MISEMKKSFDGLSRIMRIAEEIISKLNQSIDQQKLFKLKQR